MPEMEPVRSAGTGYAIKLPIFEGPLDLLLYLIEREELDITQVSLAQITDQYLIYLRSLEQINVENLADFMVIAARLILIKSQVLLPRPPAAPAGEDEDSGDDLVRQLMAYRQFKAAARALGERQEYGWHTFVRLAAPPRIDATGVDLSGVELEDLLAAVRQALCVTPPSMPVGALLRPLTLTVRDQMALIARWLQSGAYISFARLLSQSASRVEVIVTFLAVLELLKRQRIRVNQETMFGEIMIEAAGPLENWAESDEPLSL